ncbi:MAG: ATP-binding protein [Spirochaetes bacterium]|nr:ATP-binding protein [Spirochaetota bacterium]
MIENVKLKFGRSHGAEATNIEATPVTVFVGPNNSGKSKILLEIERFCRQGAKLSTDVILDEIDFVESIQEAEEKLELITLKPKVNENLQEGHIVVGRHGNRSRYPKQQLLQAIRTPNGNKNIFCSWYLNHHTIILNGQNRINLVSEKPGGDLQESPHNSFQALFQSEKKRKEVRRVSNDAFDSYLVIDPTNLGKLRLRLSKKPPANILEEQGVHPDAVKFHSEALPIEQTSDGVKAFTGMITEIIAGDPKVLLIDEPEAFLHPSLSYILGKEISLASANTDKHIFVSTHSSKFVMGCIQSGTPVNIVRLTYKNDIATARVLPNEEILKLMRHPMLRSTGVLEGLFYEYVVVTESDTDRAFYQEINERLLAFKPKWGIPNCLFINAQNKQTVQTIIKPLRELGIPTAGIVDIDVLKDGGTDWSNFLSSGFVPEIAVQSLGQLRAGIKTKLEAAGNMKTDGGVELLNVSDREAANNLLDQLGEYGLFVVRNGEVESWLKQLDASGHGPNWLVEIFENMGEDPEQATYLKPSEDDVWHFLYEMKLWFSRPDKKGIPD